MSAPGWYPDPAGDPERIRYWDGTAWTGSSAPRSGGGDPGPGRQRRMRPAVVAAVAIGLVAVVALVMLLRPGGGSPVAEDTRTARPTGSVWNELESSESPTPTKPPPSPMDTGGALVECPQVDDERVSRSSSTHVTGGNLSFPAPDGWRHPYARVSRVLTDQDTATLTFSGTTWMSFMSAGLAPASAGFTDARTTANQIIDCHLTSLNFPGLTGRETEVNEAFTIGDVDGWRVRAHAYTPEAPGGGAVFEVVVLDTGHPDGLSTFWGGVVHADDDALTALDEAVSALSVEG